MSPSPVLHAGFEQLIGTAAVDPGFKSALLREPRNTALRFGIAPADADLVADIRASDLQTFAGTLLPRLYGSSTRAGSRVHSVAG
jgi:hypothetical protein